MRIENENGYIDYTIEDDEVIIDMVKVINKRQGTGKMLVGMVKNIAREENKPCTLCAYPQDDSIEKDELCEFYESCGFECEYRGSDNEGDLYIYE